MKPKGSRELRGMITVEEAKLLKRALSAAKLEECSCSQAARDEMEQYLRSWVASPLERVINNLTRRFEAKIAKEVQP